MSGSIAVLPTSSGVANANGLESQLLGSAGRLSRPATVKLLKFPSASFAQCRLSNEVGTSGFCPSGMILPLAGAMGASGGAHVYLVVVQYDSHGVL